MPPQCWAKPDPWLTLFALLDTRRSLFCCHCACSRGGRASTLDGLCDLRGGWAGVRCVVSTTSASSWSHVRARTVREPGRVGLTCGFVWRCGGSGGHAEGMILSFGYLILRQLLHVAILVLRGDRVNEVAILVLRYQVAVLRRQVHRLDLEPADRAYCLPCPGCCRGQVGRRSSSPRPRCCAGTAAWSPAPGPTRAGRAGRRYGARSGPWWRGWPRRTRSGGAGVARVSWSGWGIGSRPDTVWALLTKAGVDPAPGSGGPAWTQFLTTQATGLLAGDFLHVDTIGLTRV